MPDPAVLQELERRRAPRRLRDLIAARLQGAEARPASYVAQHNLAASLGDAGLWRQAAIHIERAFALGSDAHESWLVRARAFSELGDFAASEAAYREVLRRRPNSHDGHRELAQLIWMRSGDLDRALADLKRAIREQQGELPLRLLEAHVLENAGLGAQAHEVLMELVRERPGDAIVALAASQSALTTPDVATALRLAHSAVQAAPTSWQAMLAYATACLAAGHADRAAAAAAQAKAQEPTDQNAIALEAVAWRLLGDPRYNELYDYQAFVRSYWLATPPVWRDLSSYISDLAQALRAAHKTQTHPFGQSVKQGTQATNILDREHAALRALPAALDPPIRQYLQEMGAGPDPLRSRNRGDYAIHGVWSIRMAAGGRHIDHVHPQGWISSACYICVPEAAPPEGWLKLGEPGVRTEPACDAEHLVEPLPGRLVLFPSYMWHGTVPFGGPGERLTLAFDLIEP